MPVVKPLLLHHVTTIIESLKSEHGSNEALQQCVDEWVSKHNDGNNDKLTDAILKCDICVAHNMLIGKTVLLPWACKVFLPAYDTEFTGSIKSVCVTIETGDSFIL